MKKKRRFLVGFFGQSPRLEFLGMLRGIFIFSSFWSSFFHHFGLRLVHHFLGSSEICREFLGIPSKIHKNDEKMLQRNAAPIDRDCTVGDLVLDRRDNARGTTATVWSTVIRFMGSEAENAYWLLHENVPVYSSTCGRCAQQARWRWQPTAC